MVKELTENNAKLILEIKDEIVKIIDNYLEGALTKEDLVTNLTGKLVKLAAQLD